jgi:hypothetical protein
MTSSKRPGQTGEQRRLLAVAIVALFLALFALSWGIWTLNRLGALGGPGGAATAAKASTATATPPTASMATRPASVTSVALAATPLPTLEPLRLRTAVPIDTPSPAQAPSTVPSAVPDGAYAVEYLGCIKHGSGTGTVKGQVFDRQGDIVVGAEIRVTLNDWTYDRPGITNTDGWYEFYLDKDLKVKIVSLRIRGQEMPLVGHENLVVKSQGGCYEKINFREQ